MILIKKIIHSISITNYITDFAFNIYKINTCNIPKSVLILLFHMIYYNSFVPIPTLVYIISISSNMTIYHLIKCDDVYHQM